MYGERTLTDDTLREQIALTKHLVAHYMAQLASLNGEAKRRGLETLDPAPRYEHFDQRAGQ